MDTPTLGAAVLELFLKYLLPPLLTGLGALLGLALKNLGSKLAADAANSKIAAVGSKLTLFIESVVADLEGTVKPALIEASADGVITAEEGAALKALAMTRVKVLLSEKGMGELSSVLGVAGPAIESLISGLIEKFVANAAKAKAIKDAASAAGVAAGAAAVTPSVLDFVNGAK